MAIVQTNQNVSTELGRRSEQTEVHASGSSSSTRGAQTTTRQQDNPEIAVVESVENPEIAATKASQIHIGIVAEFTLSWQGNT